MTDDAVEQVKCTHDWAFSYLSVQPTLPVQLTCKLCDEKRFVTLVDEKKRVDLEAKADFARRAYGYIKAKAEGRYVPSEQLAASFWVKDYEALGLHVAQEEYSDA